MKNTITQYTKTTNGLKSSHRRKTGFTRAYMAINNDRQVVIDCRIYWTNSRCYCCLWTHRGDYASGSGFAGGCGYDKTSAAVQDAITAAGFEIEHYISGVGEGAIIEALLAIAEYMDEKNCVIIQAYE